MGFDGGLKELKAQPSDGRWISYNPNVIAVSLRHFFIEVNMRFLLIITLLLVDLSLIGCGTKLEGTPENQRNAINGMEADTLVKLRSKYPDSRGYFKKAVGYAVFDSSGGKFMFGGLDHGNGVAVNARTGRRTYMKMFELQPGFGFGFTNFRIVFVFTNLETFNDFIDSGWEFGSRAAAAAKTKTEGGAAEAGYEVRPGMTMWQLTEEGAVVGVSITGAKYWHNDDLNNPSPTKK